MMCSDSFPQEKQAPFWESICIVNGRRVFQLVEVEQNWRRVVRQGLLGTVQEVGRRVMLSSRNYRLLFELLVEFEVVERL